MSEQPPRQPAWEDISIAEIESHLADGHLATALILARLRLDGIQNMPTELRLAIAADGDISATKWTDELRAFELEITQLQQIIASHTK